MSTFTHAICGVDGIQTNGYLAELKDAWLLFRSVERMSKNNIIIYRLLALIHRWKAPLAKTIVINQSPAQTIHVS